MTQQTTKQATVKSFFDRDDVKSRLNEILGARSSSFIISVLNVVNNNKLLQSATHESIYQSALLATTLNLPINNNLGFAYIVPYNVKQPDGSSLIVAQFQLGYKGYIQLALRSGQFKTISAAPIYEGQIVSANPLTGYIFDFNQRESDKIIGYASYFALTNGFEHMYYMPVEDLNKHALVYSQTFKKGFGLWKDNFDAMSLKTVLKLQLSKYAPLSIELEKALMADGGVINDAETLDVTYIDNDSEIVTNVCFETLVGLYELKKDTLTAAENKQAHRILTTNEEQSYVSLYKLLSTK